MSGQRQIDGGLALARHSDWAYMGSVKMLIGWLYCIGLRRATLAGKCLVFVRLGLHAIVNIPSCSRHYSLSVSRRLCEDERPHVSYPAQPFQDRVSIVHRTAIRPLSAFLSEYGNRLALFPWRILSTSLWLVSIAELALLHVDAKGSC